MSSNRAAIVVSRVLVASVLALVARSAGAAESEIPALRQQCQSALESGDQPAAREACMRAYLAGKTAEDIRHNVAALVGGKMAVTMGEFAEATFKADVAVKIAPGEPWGYSARCLIALRIGDRNLLDGCLADLKRVAPDHPETRRLLAIAGSSDSTLAGLGRWLLALGLFGTLAHALKSARKARPPSTPQVIAPLFIGIACVLALAAATTGRARAATPTLDRANLSGLAISDANPEASIPSLDDQLKNPLQFGYVLQDFLANAQAAVKRGDSETAARYYRALAKAVPTAYGPEHLCETLLKMGDRDGALSACREAVTREGVTLADYARLAGLLMARPDPLPKDIRSELDALVAHVSGQKEAGVEGERLRCNIASRLHDVGMLAACTSALASVVPGDAVTVSFQWTLAMEKHDFAAAKKVVEHARQLGINEKAVTIMEEATGVRRRSWFIRTSSWIVGGALAIVLLAVGARRFGLPRRRVVA